MTGESSASKREAILRILELFDIEPDKEVACQLTAYDVLQQAVDGALDAIEDLIHETGDDA